MLVQNPNPTADYEISSKTEHAFSSTAEADYDNRSSMMNTNQQSTAVAQASK
jgi:hypothetical protein